MPSHGLDTTTPAIGIQLQKIQSPIEKTEKGKQ